MQEEVARRVAVVTGSNKGMGLVMVKALLLEGEFHFSGDVYLTARDEVRGQAAVEDLKKNGIHPQFYTLDVTNQKTIEKLRDHIAEKYGGLDLLINNAGIFHQMGSDVPLLKQAQEAVDTNYFGVLNVCDLLYPLLRPHARVVHMSSAYAFTAVKQSKGEVKEKLSSVTTLPELTALMKQFVVDVQEGEAEEKGWSVMPYGISKAGIAWMTVLQQKMFNADSRADIIVNTCCPGWVRTSMGGPFATRSPEEGADTPLYLATLPPNVDSPRGEFVTNRVPQAWP